MKEFLLFQKMISPSLLQVLFWPAAAASIYFSIRLIVAGHAIGWLPLIVGTLLVRVVFELLILRFQTYESTRRIEAMLRQAGSLNRET